MSFRFGSNGFLFGAGRSASGSLARGGDGLAGLDDAQEVGGLQAGPADEGAVDVGAGEQLGRVVGLDAPAILDDDPARRRLAELRGELAADEGVDRLGLLGASPSGRCRSPRPAHTPGRRRPSGRASGCRPATARAGGRRRPRSWSDSRSTRVSPTQTIGISRSLRAAWSLALTCSSVSPWPWRRSLWPRITWVQPASTSIAPGGLAGVRPVGLVAHVLGAQADRRAGQDRVEPVEVDRSAGRSPPGRRRPGRRRTLTSSARAAAASAEPGFIFQLPATNSVRIRRRPLRKRRSSCP